MRDNAASKGQAAGLAAFAKNIAAHNLAPLWERIGSLVSREPRPRARPFMWDYRTVRAFLMEAGGLISAQDAERRVLVLENPGLPGSSRIAESLYGGLQLLLPGEHAGAHRHSVGGMRFILEGETAHTSVDEARIPMARGDLVLTPSWTWHEHGNGKDAVIWLDCLDVPMVQLFDTSFAEGFSGNRTVAPALVEARALGAAAKAEGFTPDTRWNYTYAKCRAELMANATSIDSHHGVQRFYLDPAGGSVLHTLTAGLQHLPRGFVSKTYRATDNKVFAVVEGRGTTVFDHELMAWGPNDVFVIPSWQAHKLEAMDDVVLFCYSDRAAQEKLGLWREART